MYRVYNIKVMDILAYEFKLSYEKESESPIMQNYF